MVASWSSSWQMTLFTMLTSCLSTWGRTCATGSPSASPCPSATWAMEWACTHQAYRRVQRASTSEFQVKPSESCSAAIMCMCHTEAQNEQNKQLPFLYPACKWACACVMWCCRCGHTLLLAHAKAVQLYRLKYQPLQEGRISMAVSAHWGLPRDPHSTAGTDLMLVLELAGSRTWCFASEPHPRRHLLSCAFKNAGDRSSCV